MERGVGIIAWGREVGCPTFRPQLSLSFPLAPLPALYPASHAVLPFPKPSRVHRHMLARGATRGEAGDVRLLPPAWALVGAGLAHVARAAAALCGGGGAAARLLTDPRGVRGWGPYAVARFLEELRDDGLGPLVDRYRRRPPLRARAPAAAAPRLRSRPAR